jgi:hypothetical protein
MLVAAGNAPGAPEIQQPNFAAHLLGRKSLLWLMQLRQLKSGRRLVDERRRDFVRIAMKTDEQERDQSDEQDQGD